MNRAIRGTFVFAFISGLSMVPIGLILKYFFDWPMALKMILWLDIGIYGVLLAKWSHSPIQPVLFPIVLLFGTALWPQVYTGFFMLALGVFCWIRSGICFRTTPVRSMSAELVTMMVSVTILSLAGSGTLVAWSLRVFIFFMIQSLYFFIIPARTVQSIENAPGEPFDRAFAEAEKIIREIT